MSPEWMIAFDRQEAMSHETRRKSLADPLERVEWRGLQWVNTLFGRMAAARRRQRLKSRQVLFSDGYSRPKCLEVADRQRRFDILCFTACYRDGAAVAIALQALELRLCKNHLTVYKPASSNGEAPAVFRALQDR